MVVIPQGRPDRVVGTQMGIMSWLIQRVTGAFLIVFLLAHLGTIHMATTGGYQISTIAARLQSTGFKILDIGLLALGLYHALNGVLRVLVEVTHASAKTYRLLSIIAWVLGLVLLYYGVLVFQALVG